MQLKLKRSQRDGGVVSKNVVFCLDARVEFTAQEQTSITRYKLHKQVIYNSEASQKHIQKAAMSAATGNILGGVKSIGSLAMAAMNLNISIESLQKGQHVECKSMDELLGSETAIMTACENLKGYLDTAATFDGREMLFDFSAGQPQAIASSAGQPMLVAPPSGPGPSPSVSNAPTAGPAAPTEEADVVSEFIASVLGRDPQTIRNRLIIGGVIIVVLFLLVQCGSVN